MRFDLVFEGGGAKGMVFVGALQEFESRGNTHARLLGTSAGAITAALLAAGYSSQEMLTALDEKKEGKSVFSGFMGVPVPFTKKDLQNNDILTLLESINLPLIPKSVEKKIDSFLVDWLAKEPRYRHLFSFTQLGGWYSADNFLAWLESKLDSGTYNSQRRNFSRMTLDQFYSTTRRDLSVVASDTTGGMMLVLNHRTAPDCPLVWAVRMSMSIPLLWQEVIWQPEWGKYGDQDIAGHAIVDGGLLSNFPIELFLSSLKDVSEIMGPKAEDPVMGLLIDETLPVPGADQPDAIKPDLDLTRLQTVRRISNLVNTLLSAHDKMVIDAYENLVVHLPAKNYGTTEFNMSEARREFLVAAGREAMSQYLDRQKRMKEIPEVSRATRTVQAADKLAARTLYRIGNSKYIPM